MSWPKKRLLKSRLRSNLGGSRLSLITELARLVPLMDKRVLLEPRLMGLGGGAGLGAGVGLEKEDLGKVLEGEGLELKDLGKVLEEECTFHVRPSKVVLSCFGMYKLELDRLWSLIED